MTCSTCNKEFTPVSYKGIMLNTCSQCSALWFDKDELRKAKDAHDEFLRWIDPDIWKELKKFDVRVSSKLCPRDGLPLYETQYDDTGVIIDFCTVCEGIRLDNGEFQIARRAEAAAGAVIFVLNGTNRDPRSGVDAMPLRDALNLAVVHSP